MASSKTKVTAAFGDFQTPTSLADVVCEALAAQGISPASILEPTCGVGNFLLAAADRFPRYQKAIGVEINPAHVARLESRLAVRQDRNRIQVIEASIFGLDWEALVDEVPEPILVIGNPPWVTSAELGVLGGANVPPKSNFQRHRGLDARMGKSNFDFSEWILLQLLERLAGRRATVAVLCKTAVARKVLSHAWKSGIRLSRAEIRRIDAARHFGAAVDAGLLTCVMAGDGNTFDCSVYEHFQDRVPVAVIGYRDGKLLADATAYDEWKHLRGTEVYRWRSGVKHDCAKVMELFREGGRYRNGLGELVELEDDYLFPMLKSSHVASRRVERAPRWMIVPQRAVGDDTGRIARRAPKTWAYLNWHGAALDRRASSIYRGRPRFSIFGVGNYTFAPWKVAISGLYKKLAFAPVGPVLGKPTVLDDTSAFVPCRSEQEARYLASLYNSPQAQGFYSAYLFWDAKRPITIDILRQLDLRNLARVLGSETMLERCLNQDTNGDLMQQTLFDL